MHDTAVIYACSHRKGNSDTVARILKQGVAEAGGTARIMTVRDHEVMHCKACGHCDRNVDGRLEDRCILGPKDDAAVLFEPLFSARLVFFSTPIYFYHLPSRFKTWIDRSQQFWKARMDKEAWVADLPVRKAHSVFVAGRPTGERLFEGAHLSLKYFLWNFNISPGESMCLRGVDAPGDLDEQDEQARAIRAMAAQAWKQSLE
jgi:multimeric flavodoxin WrbA